MYEKITLNRKRLSRTIVSSLILIFILFATLLDNQPRVVLDYYTSTSSPNNNNNNNNNTTNIITTNNSNGNFIVASNFSSRTSFAKCLHFDCDWDLMRCAPTSNLSSSSANTSSNEREEDYYHPNATQAPCCNDIMRQLNKYFDKEMCTLGLDYVTIFGSLLGLTRSRDVIPWSGDNDYLVLESTMATMNEHWNATRSGISLLYHGIYRMCINNHFLGGQLLEWEIKSALPPGWGGRSPIDHSRPYIDLYVGAERIRNTTNKLDEEYDNTSFKQNREDSITTFENTTINTERYFAFQPGCCIHYECIWPSTRLVVGNYEMNMPAQPSCVLTGLYGPNWRTPDPKKSRHGEDNGNPERTCNTARCDGLDLPMLGY